MEPLRRLRDGPRRPRGAPPSARRVHPGRRPRPRRRRGPGRFTLELARLGATIVAGDISPAMLAQHAVRTAEVEDAIEARELLDIEVEVCREPGALDGGTHILAVLERV